jgi:dTDP-4-amino-4,6-dideoxygalactose transaminase
VDPFSVSAVVRSGEAASLGVPAISRRLAHHYGVETAILVDHGSTAIRATLWAMKLAGLVPSGGVGIPCNVWRGVYVAAAFSGMRCVALADVDPITGVLSSASLHRGEDIDAVIAVDGYAVKPLLVSIRDQTGYRLIEDASLSQLPSRTADGRLAADVCILSLQSNKLLSCGEGGLILTDRQDLAAIIEATVCDGRRWLNGLSDEPSVVGFNAMMSDYTARLLAENVDQHRDYLLRVARGIAKVASVTESPSVQPWIDHELARSGNVFALPVVPDVVDKLSILTIAPSRPPMPPTAHLRKLLADLPSRVIVDNDYPSALAFADSNRLVPHWDLVNLAD